MRRFAELPAGASTAAVQRDAGSGRRAGLGAPMAATPVSAVPDRLPMRPGRPPALPERAPTPPPPITVHADHHADSLPEPTVAAPAAARALPSLPVVRRRGDAPPPATGPATGPTALPRAAIANTSTPASAMATVSRSASPVLPTVGARPLRPSVTPSGASPRAGATSDGTSSSAPHDAPRSGARAMDHE